MSRLESFFLDRYYRRATYAAVGFISILYALMNLLVFDREKVRVTIETICLSCLLVFVGVLLRATFRGSPPKETIAPSRPHSAYFVFGALAIGMFIYDFSQSRFIPRIQTTVIDARLSNFDHRLSFAYQPGQGQAQLQSNFRKLGSIVDASYRYEIPIESTTLNSATQKVRTALNQPKLSESTKEAGWAAYGKLFGLAATQETRANVKTSESFGYIINSNLLFKDQKLSIVGNQSPLVLGSGEIVIQNSTIVFDGIDFRAQQPYYEGLFVSSDSSVLIHDSTIENLTQMLDGVTWINVEFRHSIVKVRGGPFNLVNVKFTDCDLRLLAPPFAGPIGLDLKNRIEKANGQPITFGYEGSTPTSKPSL
jgi:hypothetical protein